MKRNGVRVYLAVSVAVFAARTLFFVGQYAGIEHDSGWYLGVARNLAQRGIYASYTNTAFDEGVGPRDSIHNRVSVQDAEGFTYFPAGVTVGPGYVVPQALLMKIFGYGTWQYRAWPVAGFVALLALLFLVAFRLGGLSGLLLFQVWLWVLPQLTISFAFEALSEQLALAFLLGAFVALPEVDSRRRLVVTGLLVGLAYVTKVLFLLPAAALGVVAVAERWRGMPTRRWARRWGLVAAGAATLPLVYEIYRFLSLTTRFGIDGWRAVNRDIELVFQSGGSGVGAGIDWAGLLYRARVWHDVGLYLHGLVWIAFLALPFCRRKTVERSEDERLWYLLYGAAAISFTWFLLYSGGWGRHVWHALMISMLLFSVTVSRALSRLRTDARRWPVWGAAAFALLIAAVPFVPKATVAPVLDAAAVRRWYDYRDERGTQGFPPLPIFPLAEQLAVTEAFRREVTASDRVYYEGGLLVAELPPLVDKVFYPLARYAPAWGRGFLIVGPYQRSSLAIVPPRMTASLVEQACVRTVFESPSYLLCELRGG